MRAPRIFAWLASTLLVVSCGGGGGPSGDTGGTGGTTGFSIKGKLPLPALAASAADRGSRASGLAVADAKKIVAFSTDRYWTGTVTAGSFELQVDPTAPVGIVFAGAANEFLGGLLLPSGLAAIPLQVKTAGVTTIDLGTLVAAGTVITPGHDPVGSEILLGPADRAALQLLEGTFGSVIRNPDIDGDGQIDVLQGRFYRPFILYFVEGGGFGGGLSATPVVPASISGFRFSVHLSDAGPFPSTVTFDGPPGSGLSGVVNDSPPGGGTSWAAYGSPYVQSPSIPPGGRYTVRAGTRALVFDVGDQSAATSHVAMAAPIVTLNADGTVQKLAWTYRLGDQSGTVKPEALVHDLIVQIDGDGSAGAPPCAANGGIGASQGTRAYNSPNLGPSVTEHLLSCQNIRWTSVRNIFMAYNDVYGNHMVVTWRK